jgi:hypothetical protein
VRLFYPQTRLLTTLLPLALVLLMVPLHHKDNAWWVTLLVGAGQCLVLGWTAQRIYHYQAQVGKTTVATWVWVLVFVLTVCLSFLLWLFSHLAL